MSKVGVVVRLHSIEGDALGTATAPPPLELGDLIATEGAVYRVVDVGPSPADAPIGAMAKVVLATLRLVSR